jgi:hypothetical protein
MSQRLQGVLGAAGWGAPRPAAGWGAPRVTRVTRVAAGWVDARTARSPNGPFSLLLVVG